LWLISKAFILGKIKSINDKITFQDHGDFHTVVISPRIEKWQFYSLLVWLIAWTACGIYFVFHLMTQTSSSKEMFVFLVLIVFWIYFEIRITRAFLWRKYGLEIIRIDKDTLSIKDSIFLHGKPSVFELEKLDADTLENIHQNPKSYGKVMNDSFWQIGQGTIVFEYEGKQVFFGTQLENEPSKQLTNHLKKVIQKFKNNTD
jgi:hypothetical protein